MIHLAAVVASLPMGGKYLTILMEQGPLVIILCALLVFGYKRYNKMTDGFIKTSEGFMLAQESRLNAIESGIKRIQKKLGVDDDF